MTTTTLDDLDPGLVAAATPWEVVPDAELGARLGRTGLSLGLSTGAPGPVTASAGAGR